ncbi:M14 family zinc carboxypeptidase [Aegicerativicinus sediminis]|uniref:M14 family zinc carboxypeptidase n=1 Tax=Aegicerativicinus sediminis TaxID=2893202 RepID=UPI001E493C6D|nr:M14 family zinc carboxypeptidase [Aegicerativicinus sediminis]
MVKYRSLYPLLVLFFSLIIGLQTQAQDYFLKKYGPFDPYIPSPEAFLGYGIGEQYTRHDRIVAYMRKLAELSPKASLEVYGYTHESRELVILTISNPQNINNIIEIQKEHLQLVDPNDNSPINTNTPIVIQLGYNVHGNEASSSEAAMLTAYTLVASQHPEIERYLKNGIIFIDPTINPDGRDRFAQGANKFRSNEKVEDRWDAEHNETWPMGRTNHYWFDLNRDWLLAVNPESQGKLKWFHKWYPNVVTDFHEMGSNSTYFFEPMKPIGSLEPIMPKENYEDLNDLFAPYYSEALEEIGSFYYTKESFDGTYPGYGSSYPDLQGGLALLFEQGGSFGLKRENDFGTVEFPFTIRNQYVNSLATVKAAVENKSKLLAYQKDFFRSAVKDKVSSGFVGYEFGDLSDNNRTKEFIDLLLKHKIKVYKNNDRFTVPMNQPQRRMVQTMFETYRKYRDSAFYDASAWSVANFYNMPYRGLKSITKGEEVNTTKNLYPVEKVPMANYAYLIDWRDYYSPGAVYHLQRNGIKVSSSFKPLTVKTTVGEKEFGYGSILVPVTRQEKSADEVYKIIKECQEKFNVPIYAVETGFSVKGIDLGSNNFQRLKTPKVAMFIGEGPNTYVNGYEVGEVWHLLDTRFHMPVVKIPVKYVKRVDLKKYNTLIMVSGSYNDIDSIGKTKISNWVKEGNTLVTIGSGTAWAINNKLVKEKLTKPEKEKDSLEKIKRLPYVDATENRGREQLGGAIVEVDLDLTHPIGFGYVRKQMPVYKNNNVFLQPSKNPYSTVAQYTQEPHIDGFISKKNYEEFLKKSASLIVSSIGSGRVVMFADNPNFRGAWYGTNKLFLNALFLGSHINVPPSSN